MKHSIIAIASLALIGFGTAAQAQTTSTKSCASDGGVQHCSYRVETPDSITREHCAFGRNGYRCETEAPESKGPPPEPTYEPVQRGGKTITIMRGMPR
jgi:hypothetical protein